MKSHHPSSRWIIFFLLILVGLLVAAAIGLANVDDDQAAEPPTPEASHPDADGISTGSDTVPFGQALESEEMSLSVGRPAPSGEAVCTNALATNLSAAEIPMSLSDWALVDADGEVVADPMDVDSEGNPAPVDLPLAPDTIELVHLCFPTDAVVGDGLGLAHTGGGHEGTWTWRF